ncbi:MAG: hypothetical protein M1148_00645 [Candidatus Thermoplasmatota archaeon]|nr:hypothetical protein [Candidatus Thermoplasmatota archaeon]MCL5437691.1 hypothetical protein [Candidatus Thermoplasmatota archaeon]
MYSVFTIQRSNRILIDQLLSDDLVGRQSLIQKDGTPFGHEGKIVIVLEGSPEALEIAGKILKDGAEKLPEEKASSIYEKIKDEEREADSGMGFLFG